MNVVYSIGVRLGGGGIGSIAWKAIEALQQQNMLRDLFCGSAVGLVSSKVPLKEQGLLNRLLRRLAVSDKTGRVTYLEAIFYDRWVDRQAWQGDLFHVWGNYGLKSLQTAKIKGLITVLQRASSHPVSQQNILQEAYGRWNIPFSVNKASLKRAVAEIDLADYILIPSDFVRRSFIEQGVLEDRLIQVPFGVETGRFRPAEDQKESARPFTVLFVGQIGIRKGVAELLSAWKKLDWADAELRLVGRVQADSREVIERLMPQSGVSIIPFTSDPVREFQGADLFVFPSWEEGSALVTYEAMACGLPTITTPNSGTVGEASNTLFVTPGDIDQLAAAMEMLRRNEPGRQEMGRAARQQIETVTWERSGSELVAAYTDLINH